MVAQSQAEKQTTQVSHIAALMATVDVVVAKNVAAKEWGCAVSSAESWRACAGSRRQNMPRSADRQQTLTPSSHRAATVDVCFWL